MGALPEHLLRPGVHRAWVRAHDGGARPTLPRAETLSPDDTDRLLAREARLIEAARPYLSALSHAAGSARHAAMLGNREALVLEVVGDDESVHGAERVPGPGALLAEADCGSNGIGTPLAEGAYAELVGPEHFISGFHVFTCQGVPLYDGRGQVLGVLSTSVRRVEASERLREILVCAARGVECELLSARIEAGIRRARTADAADDVLLEALRQDVLQGYAALRLSVPVAAEELRESSTEDAAVVLRGAQAAADRFHRTAAVWLDLAGTARAPTRPVLLSSRLADLLALLQTEASVRGMELSLGHVEPVEVNVDPRTVARSLLRLLLRAMDAAGPGGAVQVELRGARGGAAVAATPLSRGSARALPPLVWTLRGRSGRA